jgi:hypothetical protein
MIYGEFNMQRIWHYIKDGEFPSSNCICLIRVRLFSDYKYIVASYSKNDNWWRSAEHGNLINKFYNVESWADLNDVLERTYS